MFSVKEEVYQYRKNLHFRVILLLWVEVFLRTKEKKKKTK